MIFLSLETGSRFLAYINSLKHDTKHKPELMTVSNVYEYNGDGCLEKTVW